MPFFPPWHWFTTPSGYEPPSDNWLVKLIRRCQAPIIAHPLGALVAAGAIFSVAVLPLQFAIPLAAWLVCFYWQLANWERLDSISYPPREIFWRMVLSTLALLPLIFVLGCASPTEPDCSTVYTTFDDRLQQTVEVQMCTSTVYWYDKEGVEP